jgi:hypothetical protein
MGGCYCIPSPKGEGFTDPKKGTLNGIAGWRHHSQVRNNPWTMFFNGVTCHQNRIGRSLPVGNLAPAVSIPQGARSAAHSFLEGALTKAGLLSAKR